ncbi:MAG TPA: GNAT family N-acetyltransferase [Clostridia bacterium]|nr:GNAT family N-acetyltransferase [Clostridia bacterium]
MEVVIRMDCPEGNWLNRQKRLTTEENQAVSRAGRWSAGVRICHAAKGDLGGVARIFMTSFEDSIEHLFGANRPSSVAARDLFEFVLHTEPQGFFVAKSQDDRPVGYAIAITDMRRLRAEALLGGYIFRWVSRWFRGEYGARRPPVKNLIKDKIALLLSPFNLRRSEGNARGTPGQILSIAVDPGSRSAGIGRTLLRACLEYLQRKGVKRVKLEVRPWNLPALSIYRKEGFVGVGEYKDSKGAWLIMMLDLPFARASEAE